MSQQDMDRPGCLAGCDRSPRDPAVQPTPGQLLHSLHSMSREDQLDAAQRMLEASDTAVRCFTRDHDGRLARDDDERLVLLWLHAEAVWKLEHLSDWRDIDRMSLEQLLDERDRAEASRRDWAAEADRLRRELEFEANGANTFAGADAVAERGRNGVAFAVEDFGLDVDTDAGGIYISLNHRRAARTEDWGPDVSVDYDVDGVPTGVEILRSPARPQCAVHPEADR